jgi:hypothetical protein
MDEKPPARMFLNAPFILTVLAGIALVLAPLVPAGIQAIRAARSRQRCIDAQKEIARAFSRFEARVGRDGPLPFATYRDYSVCNTLEPNSPRSFLVINDQSHFDKVFAATRAAGDASETLPQDLFWLMMVIAVVKRGDAPADYKVENAWLRDGTVELRYATVSASAGSATIASPLIVSIPKGDYKAIRFVENGKPVKALVLTKKP